MMELEKWGYTRGCEEQCEAIQVRKEKMYRLSGTRKRKRSKCYKDSKRQRKTVTPVDFRIPIVTKLARNE